VKKSIVDILLFTAGQILILLAIFVAYILASGTIIQETWNADIASGMVQFIAIVIVLLISFVAPSYCGLLLIKQSFVPGLDARVALKKGQVVQVVSNKECNYPRFCIHLKLYPFEEKSKELEVSFEMSQKTLQGYRYFFDGHDLHSVIKD
jgi:hypothetical protein